MAYVIFDFDGTLVDSLELYRDIFNQWVSKRDPISETELKKLRRLPLHKIIEELKIPPWQVPRLLILARKQVGQRIAEIRVVEGIPEILAQLKRDGHVLYVMSSNSAANINKFLRIHHLESYFTSIYGNVGLFSKATVLKRMIDRNNLIPIETYYVGDEVRDIHAARRVGVLPIAVTWGMNGSTLLRSEKPYAVAVHPTELAEIVAD